jgi:predicted double-glycine peptidase
MPKTEKAMTGFPLRVSKVFIVALTASIISTLSATARTVSLKEIREAGVVIQKWDTSCGAAALATVLTYTFNDPVSEREVANGLLRQTEPLKVRHRGGFSLLDMKRYAAERGYRAIGFRGMSFDDIRYLDGPIVPIRLNGYNHYVVFKGLTPEGEIHLADPAFGNRTISRKKFEEAWMDGLAFVMLRGTL